MAEKESKVDWGDNSGKTFFCAVGDREVLIIVSENTTNDPDVVPRHLYTLTEEDRGKLESQGISREDQHNDLSIMKARYNLDKRRTIRGVEMSEVGGKQLSSKGVLKQITSLMNNNQQNGVVLHYIGHGKKNTGDWCFEDGYITFRDLAQLYISMEQFHGRVLTIISDCSHSGRWVKECRTFLDEQGVGPCGHSARDKKILIKVYTSCLATQVPAKFRFSVHGQENDKNTNKLTFTKGFDFICDKLKLGHNQHAYGLDFTQVRCSHKSMSEPCGLLPRSTWLEWSTKKRIYRVSGNERGRKAWHYLLVMDDDETILRFIKRTQGVNARVLKIKCEDYGEVLKHGLGEGPSDEEKEWLRKNYSVYETAHQVQVERWGAECN